MLRAITISPFSDPYALTTGTTALSMLALFAVLFLTPLGLLAIYLIGSGAVRAVSAGIADDPRGDFITDMPGGLRTLYPLTKLDTVEVVRRGIQYDLPRLSRMRTLTHPGVGTERL